MDRHERVGRDNDSGLLGTKASYRGLDLVISAYRHVNRIDRQQSGGGLKRAEECGLGQLRNWHVATLLKYPLGEKRTWLDRANDAIDPSRTLT